MQTEKNPILAAIFSFFITGLGQLYNGDIKMALILFGAQVLVAGFLWMLLGRIGGLISIAIWIYGIYDAYTTAQALNESGYHITQNW